MTFENLIAQGIRDTLGEKCAEHSFDEKPHRFSLAYKINRRKILRSRKSSTPFSVRQIKYVLIAVILALFALTGFSIWKQLGGFSFNVFSDHSAAYYSSSGKATIEEIYALPEEYELLEISSDKYGVRSEYMVNGKIVTLIQDVTSQSTYVNTEGNSVEYVAVNGNDGYYVNMLENISYISWVLDGYRFSIYGEINKNTSIDLAKTLKIKNFDKIA